MRRARAWFGVLGLGVALFAPGPTRAQPELPDGGAAHDAQLGSEIDAAPVGESRAPVWRNPCPAPWPHGAQHEAPVRVLVSLTVDAEGRATSALVEDEASLPTLFASAARAFALAQTFEPALLGGQPVGARVRLLVRFEPPAIDAGSAPGLEPAGARHPGEKPQTNYRATAHVHRDADKVTPSAASDLRIAVGALRQVPRQDAAQLLTLAPGVVLTNHSGEGHAYAAYLRGFSAGEGQDLEVRVQGIPINEPSNAHGHGYADTHFLIPELVHALRVVQGPFDARQGDFAVAGSVDFQLLALEPGVRAQFSYGSFKRRRLLLAWSPPEATRETFVAADLSEGDGFGPNRAHASVSAIGQYAGGNKRFGYRLLAVSHALRFDAAGVVRADAVERGELQCGGQKTDAFYCFHDPNQGGQAARHLLSLVLRGSRLQADWSQRVTVMYRTTRFRENFTGALLDARGDALDEQTRTTTLQARGHYRVRGMLAQRPQLFEVGYEGRFDLSEAHLWRVRRDGQIPYDALFDHALGLTRVSVYALGELSLARFVSASIGARADTFAYDIRDRAKPTRDLEGERLPTQSSSAWGTNYQPRVTLRLGPLATLSWVNSFGIGSRSSDAAALSEGERAPFSRVWAAESGLISARRAGPIAYDARAAFFYAYVDRDMQFDQTRGRNVPVGATNRYGAYAHLRFSALERLDTALSFAWAEAYFARGGAGFSTDARLPFVPRFTTRGDFAFRQPVALWRHLLDVRAALGLALVGPRPLPLNQESEAIFSLDLSLGARYRMFEVRLDCLNLSDRQNRSAEFYYPSDFGTPGPSQRPVRHFSAAPPRTFMATLAIVYDWTRRRQEAP